MKGQVKDMFGDNVERTEGNDIGKALEFVTHQRYVSDFPQPPRPARVPPFYPSRRPAAAIFPTLLYFLLCIYLAFKYHFLLTTHMGEWLTG